MKWWKPPPEPTLVANGDPAFFVLEAIFRRHDLGTDELAEAYRAVRAAVIRGEIACLSLCNETGCDCASRIRAHIKGES